MSILQIWTWANYRKVKFQQMEKQTLGTLLLNRTQAQ